MRRPELADRGTALWRRLRPAPDAYAWNERDLHAWHILRPLARSYEPWSSAALRPSGLVAILNDIVVLDRTTIVECGGGISTLFIARLLAERGHGTLTTFEGSAGWADRLKRDVEREGLSSYVSVFHAPLAPHARAWDTDWYDPAVVEAGTPSSPIDLLLVDGPLANRPEIRHSRYTALPVFRDRLAADATVVLDDIARQGEQEVLERWESETDLLFEQRLVDGGIALARPPGHAPLGV